MSKYAVSPGPYFHVFGMNTEVYGVNLPIQSEYRKIRARKYSVFGHFSRSVIFFNNISVLRFQQYLKDELRYEVDSLCFGKFKVAVIKAA